MAQSSFNPDREPNLDDLDAWQQYWQDLEARQRESTEQREKEQTQQEQQNIEAEQQRIEQQRQEDQRRQDEQRRYNEQRRAEQTRSDDRRKQSTNRRAPSLQNQRSLEQTLTDIHQQDITEENRSVSEPKPGGLDRHDWYNIETAHELESAMDRARAQGVDPSNEKQFQKFLDREAEQGVHQTEGKRSLADRYQELRERRDEAVQAMKRGARGDEVPSMKLYESNWEQQYRINQERQIFQENREWAQHLDRKQAEWNQKTPARQRLAEIRSQTATQTIEWTAAREKLDQIRQQHDIQDHDRSKPDLIKDSTDLIKGGIDPTQGIDPFQDKSR